MSSSVVFSSLRGMLKRNLNPQLARCFSKNVVSKKEPTDRVRLDGNVIRLIEAYRAHGHKSATVDPLALWKPAKEVPELDPHIYGFVSTEDRVTLDGYLGISGKFTVGDLVNLLRQKYCSTISAEFQHLLTLEERDWFSDRFENILEVPVPESTKKRLAKLLLETQTFDGFLANKFPTLKRYGGEGAEGNLIFLDEVFRLAANSDYNSSVVCMPHRGRLNVLVINMNYDPSYMFRKITGKSEFPPHVQATGDVLSHLFTSVELSYDNGKRLSASMIPNPSHLEANNPVTVGKARGRQQSLRPGSYGIKKETSLNDVLCIQIHGDASFAGQGIVAETFAFANVPAFTVDGSIHFITNNQIGFTAPGPIGRSSIYASDVAKMNSCPVIHVNGDCPEDVLRATRLAFEYRDKFRKDVVIDLVCYRLHGHNEVDDPTFTQPEMYAVIQAKKSVPDTYAEKLLKDGILLPEERKKYVSDFQGYLKQKFDELGTFEPKAFHLEKQWSGLSQPKREITVWDTGVQSDVLKYVGAKSVTFPGDFNIHPHLLKTHIKNRLERITAGSKLDWATAEALAIGSLLLQGYYVRLSGQDVGRGTFSHRHAILTDQQNNSELIPLNYMDNPTQSYYEVANTILSEEAVLGFEYGMSIENPNRLVIWEAQFGDFFTGAQIMFDTYITTGETKWLIQSGIVILLPHGYDGAGPEHSSCRIERFLQQSDSSETVEDSDAVNFSFVNPTTPAQYFHLLRRQMVRNFRKPLIMASPKTLLRLPAATSDLLEMQPGTSFQPVLVDNSVDSAKVEKIVFLSGKHFYAMDKYREASNIINTALVRIEELAPFPMKAIQQQLTRYPNAKKFVWSQEEPRNMGAWTFVKARFQNLLGINLSYAGRPELPATAVGISEMHEKQNSDVLQQTFQ